MECPVCGGLRKDVYLIERRTAEDLASELWEQTRP
jgi:hypothetical protein